MLALTVGGFRFRVLLGSGFSVSRVPRLDLFRGLQLQWLRLLSRALSLLMFKGSSVGFLPVGLTAEDFFGRIKLEVFSSRQFSSCEISLVRGASNVHGSEFEAKDSSIVWATELFYEPGFA